MPTRATAVPQEVILLTPHGGTLKILQRAPQRSSWQPDSVDLTEFIGQDFYIYFNVYTDGSPRVRGCTWTM